jgi:carbonic anhydrase/acetyltransferase-like protein (isoleucine patch superfamily)
VLARILATDHVLPPWGDRPATWPVLVRPALDHTRDALLAAGLALDLAGEAADRVLLLPDDLLLSTEFVRDFLAIAGTRPADRPLVACLGPGLNASRSAGRSALPPGPDGSLPVPLVLWQGRQGPAPTCLDELLEVARTAEAVVVDAQEKTQELPVPRAYCDPGKETMTVGGSARVALHLRHRSHLLQANSELLGATFLRTLGGNKVLLALRWLWGRLRPGPRRLFSRIGKGCKIHPTAIIEGATLGPGCEIGAFAIVRASVLGAGVAVEDGAQVQMCVAGDKVRVGRQTAMLGCVLMEGSNPTMGMMQFSVLGRHTATTKASWFQDTRFDGKNIQVEAPPGDPRRMLDAGTRFLSVDVGHGTLVGANVMIAAGRMLPGNAQVIGDPALVATRIDETFDRTDAGGAILVARDGRLQRLDTQRSERDEEP